MSCSCEMCFCVFRPMSSSSEDDVSAKVSLKDWRQSWNKWSDGTHLPECFAWLKDLLEWESPESSWREYQSFRSNEDLWLQEWKEAELLDSQSSSNQFSGKRDDSWCRLLPSILIRVVCQDSLLTKLDRFLWTPSTWTWDTRHFVRWWKQTTLPHLHHRREVVLQSSHTRVLHMPTWKSTMKNETMKR